MSEKESEEKPQAETKKEDTEEEKVKPTEAAEATAETVAEDEEMKELEEELAKEEEEGPEEAEEAAAAVEEEKPPEEKRKEKEEEKEEDIVEERVYTVPLSKAWIYPAKKRTPRAMRILKSFITKHMKLEAKRRGEEEQEEEPAKLVISNEVNMKMWSRGIGKPPRKIRVRAAKDREGNVTVYLAEGD